MFARDAREQEVEFGISHDRYAFRHPSRLQSTMSSDKQTTNRPKQTSSLEADISALASLIASTKKPTTTTTNGNGTGNPETVEGEEIEELGAEDVEELLRRLEPADGIAEGVEGKLDGILEHLDGLLSSLEAKESGSGPVDPQPDR